MAAPIDITNPYRIEGPALISFSGGRTSAFMLRQILDAHGGVLPKDVHVAFANTGKEHPGTLRFVHECESRWLVSVHWIEWRAKPSEAKNRTGFKEWLAANDPHGLMLNEAGFERVGLNSASGNGEPFETLIALERALPNGRAPFCTIRLKIEPAAALARSLGLGEPGEYLDVIGIRHDEPKRLLKGKADAIKHWRRVAYPLASAQATKADVLGFWREQDFDLETPEGFGNCDLCWRKGQAIRRHVIRQEPWRANWWIRREVERGHTFDSRTSVARLATEVRTQPHLPGIAGDVEEYDAECGLVCAAEAA